MTQKENEIISETVRDLSKELREFAQAIQRIETQQKAIRRELEQIKELRDKLARTDQRVSDLETRNERVPVKLERLPDPEELDGSFEEVKNNYVSKSEVKWFILGITVMFTAIEFALNYFM